jgi:hypothetical protein
VISIGPMRPARARTAARRRIHGRARSLLRTPPPSSHASRARNAGRRPRRCARGRGQALPPLRSRRERTRRRASPPDRRSRAAHPPRAARARPAPPRGRARARRRPRRSSRCKGPRDDRPPPCPERGARGVDDRLRRGRDDGRQLRGRGMRLDRAEQHVESVARGPAVMEDEGRHRARSVPQGRSGGKRRARSGPSFDFAPRLAPRPRPAPPAAALRSG